MKLALPSEESARLRSMAVVEAPMKPARNYSQALSALCTWVHSVKSTIYHMKRQTRSWEIVSGCTILNYRPS
eukprot:6473904-Amphidinium_carterae.1